MKTPLLIDMDGVLRIGNDPAEGIQNFFNFLSSSNYNPCILSNSTLSDSIKFKKYFERFKINCPFPIMTTVDAARNLVEEKYKRIQIYCNENVKHLFEEFIDEENPEAIIIGDIGKAWNFEILNDIFKKVREGTDFIAMQKNKFWNTPDEGIMLDAGSFIKAIEHAAGIEAQLIGKPSETYFNEALKMIGEDRGSKFLMLGDDLETDITGAQKLNSEGILILTGKTNKKMLETSEIKPDYVVKDLGETIEFLKNTN